MANWLVSIAAPFKCEDKLMDTFREYTDSSHAAITESNIHKDAYSNDAHSASRLPMNNDSALSNQLEQKGLLPTVTLANGEQTVFNSGSRTTSDRDSNTTPGNDATTGSDANTPRSADATATPGARAEIPVDARRQINTLSNARGGIGYSEQVNQGLRGIVDRHGAEGFNRMIGVLDALSNGNFASYRHDLWNHSSDQLDTPRTANQLNNLERLSDPEAAQQVLDLNRTMREEGYTQRLSIEDLSPENITMLSTQPEQRRAFIEFNNEARHSMGPAFFLQENPEMLDTLPSEQLRLYRIWQEQRREGH
jgi:hypothetical protein